MIKSIYSTFSKYAIAALAFMGCFFMYACENELQQVQDLGKKTPGVEEGKKIESFLSQGGKMRARLRAPLMLRYLLDTPRIEFPKTMHVDFFDDTLGIESRLDAKYGQYKENDNIVLLRDSVVAFNRMGDTLWTNEMYWDQNRGLFYSDKPAKMIQSGSLKQAIYSTQGFRSNQTFSNITFFGIINPSYAIVPDSTY
jgi:hypothetical protein